MNALQKLIAPWHGLFDLLTGKFHLPLWETILMFAAYPFFILAWYTYYMYRDENYVEKI